MRKPKSPASPKVIDNSHRTVCQRLDTGDIKNRIHDCRGAVALAIDGILDGDVDSIDAAIGSLSLVERELQQLNIAIDLADIDARSVAE